MTIHSLEHFWILETASTGYALGINREGLLTHSYWGERLPSPQDYPHPPAGINWASFNDTAHLTPEEYPTSRGMKFTEPCILTVMPDGTRDLRLRFMGAETRPDPDPELHLRFRDEFYPVEITLHYRLFEAEDLIERSVSVSNLGAGPVTINRIFSAVWNLPPGDGYRLTHLTGRWYDEFHLRRETLTHGIKVLESRRLTTSHHHNPWFAVDEGTAGEEQGKVWFGILAWSGNWKMEAEVTDFASTRVHIGINDWDFAWRLNGGETFTTPPALAGFTADGFGSASRKLHDHIRDRLLPHGKSLHKVLYNSWEATAFDVDEASQAALAEIAAEIGVEIFVVDDGWFHGRKDDRAGLGDWWPDEKKFPRGLAPLIEKVNGLGMDFGLWIEPEMVNPDSDLYRAHPDWVIHFPNRPRSEGRNQLILNLGRGDVREYLFEKINGLLSDNNIRFIKWDMNRNVSELGWPDAPGDPRELWVRYVEGLYSLWGRLRQAHPQVFWQSCSGGGGRADPGILRLADQIWVSDNTEASARLSIQEGFSQVFPASTMEAWVTDARQDVFPLAFRFHVSMCGVLGVGAHLGRWDSAQRAEAARHISKYKEVRHIVQLGDLYRLNPAQGNCFSALEYISKDRREGLLFVFRTYIPEPVGPLSIHLQGLEPAANYSVEGIEGIRSGAAWMESGLEIYLNNFQSTMRRICREDTGLT